MIEYYVAMCPEYTADLYDQHSDWTVAYDDNGDVYSLAQFQFTREQTAPRCTLCKVVKTDAETMDAFVKEHGTMFVESV